MLKSIKINHEIYVDMEDYHGIKNVKVEISKDFEVPAIVYLSLKELEIFEGAIKEAKEFLK